MKNNKGLITVAVLIFVIGIACVFASVILTTPYGSDLSFDLSSSDNVQFISSDTFSNVLYSNDEISQITSIEQSEDEVARLILKPEMKINSDIAVVYDVSIGEILYKQNESTTTAPASLTKLVTALVVLDYLEPNKKITVGNEIDLIGENSSIAFLEVGQKYSVKALIDALLIPSGNDAAYVLAVNTARVAANDTNLTIEKAVSDFIRLMNNKAKEIGCTSTYFYTPDGYDAVGQVTNALDMLKISIQASKNATIRESVSKENSSGWVNSNKLICKNSGYYNECVTGLKTGSTTGAGYCVAVSAEINNSPYIFILMNSSSANGRFKDALTFIDLIKEYNCETSIDVSQAS